VQYFTHRQSPPGHCSILCSPQAVVFTINIQLPSVGIDLGIPRTAVIIGLLPLEHCDLCALCKWVLRGVHCSMKEVMAEMEARSLQRVTSEDELTGQTYMVDTHCRDLLHFPSDLLDMLEQHPLIEQCHLVLQVGQ